MLRTVPRVRASGASALFCFALGEPVLDRWAYAAGSGFLPRVR